MKRRVAVFGVHEADAARLADELCVAGWQAWTVGGGEISGFACHGLILDLDDAEAMSWLRKIRAGERVPGILAIGSEAAPETIVRVMRAGADNYLVKPVDPAAMSTALAELLPDRVFADQPLTDGMIAEAPAMRQAVDMALRTAKASIPVLLTGASGTGKESFARLIHAHSGRADGPFQAVNCGALPETLVESLLFGHEKGAFTGADRQQKGYFRAAHGGTIFLDEIGELPLGSQVKILRALQEREVQPVGSSQTHPIDVRVVSATNRMLRDEVAARHFRRDLYFRLSGVEIRLPSLAERAEDIPPIAQAHAQTVASLEDRVFEGFGPGVTEWLAMQDWPGNVRELQSAIYRAMVLSDEPVVPLSAFMPQDWPGLDRGESGQAPSDEPAEREEEPARIRPLSDLEAEAIADALMFCRGQISAAARQLGIGRSTLYRKMDQYGIGPMGNRDQSDGSSETGS